MKMWFHVFMTLQCLCPSSVKYILPLKIHFQFLKCKSPPEICKLKNLLQSMPFYEHM